MHKTENDSAAKGTKPDRIKIPQLCGRDWFVDFDEPELTSDAGIAALAASGIGNALIASLGRCIEDRRSGFTHGIEQLLGQRIYQIISGAYDANDCDYLRHDLVLRSAAGRNLEDGPLASQPTMSRLEGSVRPRELLAMAEAIFEGYLQSFGSETPRAVCIDMDPSAHLVYGQQQLALFNAHVGEHCLMPFYIFDGQSGKIMTAALRPGKTPTAREILAILKRLVKRLRDAWPQTKIIFRADGHHTKPAVMDYMRAEGVEFITGLPQNAGVERLFGDAIFQARRRYQRLLEESGGAQGVEVTRFASCFYGARSWSEKERVVARIKVSSMGVDVRYIVTSFHQAEAKYLYESVYCGRGEAELYIKECKLGLGSDTSPCQKATANQFRLLLHVAAYAVMHQFREKILGATKWARASFAEIRLRVLKVAGRLEVKKTRICLHLAEAMEPVLGGLWRALAKPIAPAPG